MFGLEKKWAKKDIDPTKNFWSGQKSGFKKNLILKKFTLRKILIRKKNFGLEKKWVKKKTSVKKINLLKKIILVQKR